MANLEKKNKSDEDPNFESFEMRKLLL